MMVLPASLFAAGACAAAVSDLRARKVSNRLNLAILVGGLGWRATTLDPMAVALGIAGAAVGVAVLFIPFAARWMGAGDVKLLAALGAWLGPHGALLAGLFGLVGGGLLSLALAVAGGVAVRREVARNLTASVMTLSSPVAPRRAQPLVVPLAVPLAASAIAVFFARGF